MLVSIAEEMNPTRRNTQEDVHVVHDAGSWGAPNANATFLGVMDGHGGRQIVDYLEQHLAKNVANEWTFAAKQGGRQGKNDGNSNDDGGSTSTSVELQPPKKRRLHRDNIDDDCDNSIHDTNADADTILTALLDAESKTIQTALERAFLITDIQSRIDGIITSGATVACCIVVPNFSPQTGNLTSITIHAANVGDARAVLSSGTAQRRRRRHFRHSSLPNFSSTSQEGSSKSDKTKAKKLLPNPELANELPLHRGTNAIRITHDHKSTDPNEISRIQSAGGIIIRGRVLGVLAVARSLGDHGLKEFVIAKPYLSSTTVRVIDRQHHRVNAGKVDDVDDTITISSQHQTPFTDDEFLVVACDGLWDVMDDQEVVDFIRKFIHVHEEDNNENSMNRNRENVATFVVEEAMKRGSTDNITVIVCWL